jgi:hypothetical protein
LPLRPSTDHVLFVQLDPKGALFKFQFRLSKRWHSRAAKCYHECLAIQALRVCVWAERPVHVRRYLADFLKKAWLLTELANSGKLWVSLVRDSSHSWSHPCRHSGPAWDGDLDQEPFRTGKGSPVQTSPLHLLSLYANFSEHACVWCGHTDSGFFNDGQ